MKTNKGETNKKVVIE
ncbi:hypothetical protein [Polaribacter sp. R2A056_3_33]